MNLRLYTKPLILTLLLIASWNVGVRNATAQIPYPFELPDQIQATLDVDTTKKISVNHMLLGLNCNWPEGQYGKIGYNHPDAQKLIKKLKPSSLRFPHGVWANFYDWESDGRRITDDYKTPYDSAVKDHPELKYGFDGFHKLHQQLGFDVLFTFNVNYDSPEKTASRLTDRRDKGFDVKWVELGNEIFWKTQRSNAVSDVEKYIEVSRSHAAALKAVSPDLKVSVPAHWRTAVTNPWNLAMKKHDYFDAITLHKHIGNDENRDGAAKTLAARDEMVETGQTLRQVFPGKPIWVSEWSVGCGDNAISVLSMADTCIGLLTHPELFEIADYFQINASHALIQYDQKTRTHKRTSYGAAFQIIRSVFENSEICDSQNDSTKIGNGMDAVSCEAVVRDGRVTVVAINKTTSDVPLAVKIDGLRCNEPFVHHALSFDDLNKLKIFGLDESVLTAIEPEAGVPHGTALLPPLSISRLSLK